jgi:hypothetical protein
MQVEFIQSLRDCQSPRTSFRSSLGSFEQMASGVAIAALVGEFLLKLLVLEIKAGLKSEFDPLQPPGCPKTWDCLYAVSGDCT